MSRIEFSMVRPGEGDRATITAEVNRRELEIEQEFQREVIEAITEWVIMTEDGKAAWKQSCYDFNVGDLAMYQDEKSLQQLFHQRGIDGLEVHIGDPVSDNWLFDTILVDETKLPDDIDQFGVSGEPNA